MAIVSEPEVSSDIAMRMSGGKAPAYSESYGYTRFEGSEDVIEKYWTDIIRSNGLRRELVLRPGRGPEGLLFGSHGRLRYTVCPKKKEVMP